ncbi:MAG TPA: class I SAM-dependent methyltransferase [Rhodospirillales bacterium]
MGGTEDKHDIQAFWGALYDSLYDDVDRSLNRERLIEAIGALEDMFRLRHHMAVVEMPLAELKGKRVLEIGCGAGGHSALFARHGAVVTAVDITEKRVAATAAKFRLLGADADGCRAMQADAEALPFVDASFDIVYSNGVLHHTRDIQKALDEAFRMLRPGGLAVIMLYCKSSWHYWINMWLCVGVLKGRAFGDKNWLGRATEWGGRDAQTVENPITRCYTAAGIRRLFRRFHDVRMRKGEFYFYLIPKLGRLYRRWQVRRYGTHPGGYLAYGEPWSIASPLEMRLGRAMGFAWFIQATKP